MDGLASKHAVVLFVRAYLYTMMQRCGATAPIVGTNFKQTDKEQLSQYKGTKANFAEQGTYNLEQENKRIMYPAPWGPQHSAIKF